MVLISASFTNFGLFHKIRYLQPSEFPSNYNGKKKCKFTVTAYSKSTMEKKLLPLRRTFDGKFEICGGKMGNVLTKTRTRTPNTRNNDETKRFFDYRKEFWTLIVRLRSTHRNANIKIKKLYKYRLRIWRQNFAVVNQYHGRQNNLQ